MSTIKLWIARRLRAMAKSMNAAAARIGGIGADDD
jgi:hypothetical protein